MQEAEKTAREVSLFVGDVTVLTRINRRLWYFARTISLNADSCLIFFTEFTEAMSIADGMSKHRQKAI